MSQTVIRGTQILNNTVQRQDLDTSTVGQAVVTKIIQGSGISLSSTGADAGTGDVTVTSPDVVSTDVGNIATLGTDNHILVPQSQIWSVRLRSFNAVGSPNFEVSQRNVNNILTNPAHGSFIEDRWQAYNNGSLNPIFQVSTLPTARNVPGTSFGITRAYIRMAVGTVKSSLAATDIFGINTQIEGPMWRELQNDVHSLSLLLRSTVNCKLGVALRDAVATTKSLTKLVTLTANTDTLVQLPNLPVWPAGNFTNAPGSSSYQLGITLAAGSTYTSPANDTWQSGNFVGAVGQDNYLANPVNSEVNVFFIQHEPGAQCTTPIDCPFTQNYDDCLRYYQKTYDYPTAIGTVTGAGCASVNVTPSAGAIGTFRYVKPMAKLPTIFPYSPATGASGNVRDVNAAVDRGVGTAFQPAGLAGFSGWNLGTLNAAATYYSFHYTADTGW